MTEVYGLIEAHGEENVREAVNEVAKERFGKIICVKCGLVKPAGYLGDGGWRCNECGFFERFGNGVANNIRAKLRGEWA